MSTHMKKPSQVDEQAGCVYTKNKHHTWIFVTATKSKHAHQRYTCQHARNNNFFLQNEPIFDDCMTYFWIYLLIGYYVYNESPREYQMKEEDKGSWHVQDISSCGACW